MELVLQPIFAPAGRARAWLGVFDADAPPVVSWLLDGNPADGALANARPLAPALSPPLLGARAPRCFTGVVEIAAAPGADHRLTAREAGGAEAEIVVRSLPAELPRLEGGLDVGWFNVLVASCYHRPQARPGAVAAVLRRLPPGRRLDLALFLGDQVYLDLPTLKNFPGDAAALAEILEANYVATWRESLAGAPLGGAGEAALFAAAPRVCIPDDHEYWNNAPHSSPFIENSWRQQGRDHWKQAGDELFRAFQLPDAQPIGSPIRFEVPPLSFLLLDSRSDRQEDHSRSLAPGAAGALAAWEADLLANRHFGVFATGQSVVGDRAGWLGRLTAPLAKRVGDYGLADYGDFASLVGHLAQAARPERPLLCLTGDVHFGRVAIGRRRGTEPRPCLYEVISSPTALVETVGADPAKRAWNWARGLVGRADPWPRHGDAKPPPPELSAGDPARDVELTDWRGQRGDHVALLSFRSEGPASDPQVALEVRYYPIVDPAELAGAEQEPIRLRLGDLPQIDPRHWETVEP